jgi:hypothetical protein
MEAYQQQYSRNSTQQYDQKNRNRDEVRGKATNRKRQDVCSGLWSVDAADGFTTAGNRIAATSQARDDRDVSTATRCCHTTGYDTPERTVRRGVAVSRRGRRQYGEDDGRRRDGRRCADQRDGAARNSGDGWPSGQKDTPLVTPTLTWCCVVHHSSLVPT